MVFRLAGCASRCVPGQQSEYEQRFLKRDVEGTLLARGLNPINWSQFIGGNAGRSELAADYYDEILFERATFGDLLDKQTPVALATGTEISNRGLSRRIKRLEVAAGINTRH